MREDTPADALAFHAVRSGAHAVRRSSRPPAHRLLDASAALWLSVAVLGQWTFAVYIASRYWTPTVQGHFDAVKTSDLIKGYVAGDAVGNLYFAAHVLIAALITAIGALQLVPQIRARAIGFHRWNGRLYLGAAVIAVGSGLWMIWVRHTYFTLAGALASTLLPLVILVCAAMTVVAARTHALGSHRRWALRAFIVVNAVWFQRLGYMAWAIFAKGAGTGDHMDGPFDLVWGFGCYVLPLAVLELYLRAKDRAPASGRFAMAGALVALTAVMGVGIAGAIMFMWRRYL